MLKCADFSKSSQKRKESSSFREFGTLYIQKISEREREKERK
jgi:hypothetical protein